MTLIRKYLVLATILIAAQPAVAEPDDIDGADIIDRVDRVLRVSPSTASTWYAGVASLDAWPARLERALIETLGPAELRATDAGLHTLEALLGEGSPGTPVTQDARDALAVVVELVKRQVSLVEERDRLAQALEHEREAHRQTTDKLNSLRQIDNQLDERENNGGR